MNKIVRWALLAAVAVVVGFTAFHYFYFGKEETIAIFERVKDFMNQPLPIVGVSTLVIGAFVLKALSMTSFGNAQISKLKAECSEYRRIADDGAAELKRECDEFRESVSKAIAEMESRQECDEETTELILGYIKSLPNKKAKELIRRIEDDDRAD